MSSGSINPIMLEVRCDLISGMVMGFYFVFLGVDT